MIDPYKEWSYELSLLMTPKELRELEAIYDEPYAKYMSGADADECEEFHWLQSRIVRYAKGLVAWSEIKDKYKIGGTKHEW